MLDVQLIQERLGHRRVLVAEDVAMNQWLIRSVLEKWGWEPYITVNGAAALQALQEQSFDLVLMDIQMPVMDGVEATRRIRSWQNEKANIPIIAVTANASEEDIIRYRAAGITDIVAKPLYEPELYKIIEAALLSYPSSFDPEFSDTAAEEPLYSLELMRNFTDDAAFMQEMLLMFLDGIPESVRELTEYAAAENWVELEKLAHKIKGTVVYLKMTRAIENIAIIKAYKTTDKKEVVAATARLIQVLEKCAIEMRKEIL